MKKLSLKKTNNLKLFEQSFFSERTHFLKEIKSYDFFQTQVLINNNFYWANNFFLKKLTERSFSKKINEIDGK